MNAPCASFPDSCCWFCCQYIGYTSCCTQIALRRKVLDYDMSKYQCFQGYHTICCCIKGGACCESYCPTCCLCLESCLFNCIAVSASRTYIMEKYNLGSDPCDYRLIRCNNCLQALACACRVLSVVMPAFRALSSFVDHVAEFVYYTISGCMTAQVSHFIIFGY